MEVPKFVFAGFKKHFDTTTVFTDTMCAMITGKYSFDVFGFEKWIRSYGYDPDVPGSIADFVTKRFGAGAKSFLESILKL